MIRLLLKRYTKVEVIELRSQLEALENKICKEAYENSYYDLKSCSNCTFRHICSDLHEALKFLEQEMMNNYPHTKG